MGFIYYKSRQIVLLSPPILVRSSWFPTVRTFYLPILIVALSARRSIDLVISKGSRHPLRSIIALLIEFFKLPGWSLNNSTGRGR